MAVIFQGSLNAMLGSAGLSIEYAKDDTIGAAHTFAQPFAATPAIFVSPSSDAMAYAASSATTGFTPTDCSASSAGAGTTCDWVAIGKGTKQPMARLWNAFDIGYGGATKDTAIAYDGQKHNENPAVICSAISDIGLFTSTDTAAGFTPEDCTGDGGSGTTGAYFSVGTGTGGTVQKGATADRAIEARGVELGTFTIDSAVTFTVPFDETPKIITGMTSDDICMATSSASTGFTPEDATLTGAGGGTTGVYLAIGARRL